MDGRILDVNRVGWREMLLAEALVVSASGLNGGRWYFQMFTDNVDVYRPS